MKNKIISISNELNVCLDKNIVLQNKIDAHVCHVRVVSHTSPIACSTSSLIENDINLIKKKMDCLGSTMSQCAMNHTRLDPWFERNKFHLYMHTIHGIHMIRTFTPITQCMFMCTLVHIVDVRATLLNFVLIVYMLQI